ncbi:NAD(P)-binding Rossmann-fold containing protein [Glarea lozoyensis ATCC 20868]|uniref:NAD(P)-binding Rossmann-fold containing protein n=1 Tax=Glarea lozoyensis (strain ATCC 20868 / MF5171) TaxID=1116229 RepID=S3DWX4_GLAL2|nr:NAD(P)-binding Rossmann-fold containing protein [Glarea lozoyensis ATCC 20868]EPE36451.1 NAD(P)-binding Rossmann-fold containing protein [Glarea lozoyensis ATCC 20868]
MGGYLGFMYRQLTYTPKPLPQDTSISGNTILVTGANIGLGYEAARHLASHSPSRLILAVRNITTGEATKEAISKASPDCNIEVWPLDYDSYDSIIAFSKRAATLERLDYVLLNAGVKQVTYTTASSGHETNIQINHISTSLLSLLLLPILQATARKTNKPSRLTLVSSEGHFWTPFKERTAPSILTRMDEKETFRDEMERYNTSKLLNVLWVRELARKVDGAEVLINTLNPGFCHSGIHRNGGGMINLFLWLLGWTTEQGGYCLADALVGHGDSHGKYISEQKITEPSNFVLSEEGEVAQRRIWDETVDLLRKEAPKSDIVIP